MTTERTVGVGVGGNREVGNRVRGGGFEKGGIGNNRGSS